MIARRSAQRLTTLLMLSFLSIVFTTMVFTTNAAVAAESVPEQMTAHDQINNTVLSYLQSFYSEAELSGSSPNRQVTISVSSIDPRLRLKTCTIPLTTSMNRNRQPIGKISIKVECRNNSYWSKLVSADVRVYEPVLVAARPIARGSIVSSSDLETINMDLSQRRNSYLQGKDQELIIGLQAKRNITLRSPIALDAFKQQIMVKRGDTVIITARSGQISIRQQGKALQDGVLGKQIDIRNSRSNIVIQAVVVGPQQVNVVL